MKAFITSAVRWEILAGVKDILIFCTKCPISRSRSHPSDYAGRCFGKMPRYWFCDSYESCNRVVSSRVQLEHHFTLQLDKQCTEWPLKNYFLSFFFLNVLIVTLESVYFLIVSISPQCPDLIDLGSLWNWSLAHWYRGNVVLIFNYFYPEHTARFETDTKNELFTF